MAFTKDTGPFGLSKRRGPSGGGKVDLETGPRMKGTHKQGEKPFPGLQRASTKATHSSPVGNGPSGAKGKIMGMRWSSKGK